MLGSVEVVGPQLVGMAEALRMPVMAEAPAMEEPAGGGGTEGLAAALVAMAATAYELNTQAHLVHFNVEGTAFFELHAFFKSQYEKHIEQFDVLSELVRSLDYLMPLCSCGLKEAVSCFEHIADRTTRSMLMTYLKNLEAFGMAAKELEKMAQQECAPDVANYAAELVGAAFKDAWMVKSYLRG